jgi:hypothetical protein
MDGKYILNYGIHRGTLMSRDLGDSFEFDTEEKAIQKAKELKKEYADMGYYIWFANIQKPDGQTMLNIVPPVPYER